MSCAEFDGGLGDAATLARYCKPLRSFQGRAALEFGSGLGGDPKGARIR